MKTNNMVVVAVTSPRIWAYFIFKSGESQLVKRQTKPTGITNVKPRFKKLRLLKRDTFILL